MENLVNMNSINDLLTILGYNNISVVNKPIFYWNGNCVTDDETAQVKRVGDYYLNKESLLDLIKINKDNKMVILANNDKIIDKNNKIRFCVL